MEQNLVINALGVYQPHILSRLTRSVRECGANISDFRMDILGREISVSALVSGPWDSIAKLEDMLPRLEKELALRLQSSRTGKREPDKSRFPYSIEIVTASKGDLINEITEYLTGNDINIRELYTNTFDNPHTDMKLLSIHMIVSIPSQSSISLVRSEFLDFCDRLNLDAIFEPSK